MDIIRFRGKCTEQCAEHGKGQWKFGNYSTLRNPFGDQVTHFIDADNGVAYEIAPESLGQFSCLYDENLKEVYERDILEVWMDGVKQNSYYLVKDLRDLYLDTKREDSYFRITRMRIVGNAIDNPELLPVC